MEFNTATPRADIIVQGTKFSCPQPFVEGYPLKANEASALNGLLAENLRNNIAGKFKEDDVFSCTQEQFDEYASQYEFGARRGGGTREASLSPVEREARRIAKDRITARLKELGKKIDTKTEAGKATMDKLVADLSAQPAIVREAEKRVKAVEKISLEELGIDLGGEVKQAA